MYEIIVFTSSDRRYAEAVIKQLDPDHTLIHHSLYREHCTCYSENLYIKDLRILNRDLKNVIMVDNAPYAFACQLDNGYPMISYFTNKNDKELSTLKNYLEEQAEVGDIREKNRENFKLQWLCTLDIDSLLKHCEDNKIPIENIENELRLSFNSFFK